LIPLAVLALVLAASLRILVPALRGRFVWSMLALGAAALAGLYVISVTLRPPMPLKLGKLVWDYECGFTVDRVERKAAVRRGLRTAHGRGTLYVVHVRVVCPFGERYRWDPSRAYVVSEAAPWPSTRYAVDSGAQAIVDERAGTPHTVLGARDSEMLAFDLPTDIPQPALIFTDTLGFRTFLDNARVGRLYLPLRFNLRYD